MLYEGCCCIIPLPLLFGALTLGWTKWRTRRLEDAAERDDEFTLER